MCGTHAIRPTVAEVISMAALAVLVLGGCLPSGGLSVGDAGSRDDGGASSDVGDDTTHDASERCGDAAGCCGDAVDDGCSPADTGTGRRDADDGSSADSPTPVAGERVPAHLPTDPDAWSWQPDMGFPPEPGRPMAVAYVPNRSHWLVMGRTWGDDVHQHVFTSPDGLGDWKADPDNPVIRYDSSFNKRDADFYWQNPNFGRDPAGGLRRWNGDIVVVGVNFDGKDTHPQSLTSKHGFDWSNRTTIQGIDGPEGSGDRGEQWPETLVFNPDDSRWYLFYNGGGSHQTGSGRTIGVARGSSPTSLSSVSGSFEHDGRITQKPIVFRDAGGWKMLFQHGFEAGDGVWYATSSNLTDWSAGGRLTGTYDVSIFSWAALRKVETIAFRIYGVRDGVKGVWTAEAPVVRK